MASCDQEILLLRSVPADLMHFNSQFCSAFQRTSFSLALNSPLPLPSTASSAYSASSLLPPPPPPSSLSSFSAPSPSTSHPPSIACKENRALKVSLKRNKPTKLSIPDQARLASFHKANQFQAPEESSSKSDLCYTNGPDDPFRLAMKKGRKPVLEDGYLALPNFKGQATQGFFSVFDGHGGVDAVRFAAEKLGENIAEAMDSEASVEDAMIAGYGNTDAQFLAKDVKSGACSVSALVSQGQLVVANAGDCKAVLCRAGKAEPLSTLHRASNKDERQRIEDLDGFVACVNGTWRLQGTLAVTRGFGDKNLKRWVSSRPDVTKLKLMPECEFLILASDGLWDKVSDQEAVDCVREASLVSNASSKIGLSSSLTSTANCDEGRGIPSLSNKQLMGDGLEMNSCKMLIQKASSRGNIDDITVMVVPLQSFSHHVEARL